MGHHGKSKIYEVSKVYKKEQLARIKKKKEAYLEQTKNNPSEYLSEGIEKQEHISCLSYL